jgi:hypothetical protein
MNELIKEAQDCIDEGIMSKELIECFLKSAYTQGQVDSTADALRIVRGGK